MTGRARAMAAEAPFARLRSAAPWLLAAAFAAAVGALKLAQHFSFQTQAYDLGVFTSALWNTLEGRFLFNAMTGRSYLGDHFSPFLALLSPAFLLWRNAGVLLLIQTLALALAIPAVHRVAAPLGPRPALALAAAFALNPYVHRVSAYDFHDAALAVPLYLWAMAFWREGRLRPFLAALAAATVLREDMPLMTMGVGLYAAVFSGRRADPRWRRAGLGIAGAAAVLFALDVAVFLPAFGGWRAAAHSYGNLGGDGGSIFRSLLDPVVLGRAAADGARWKGVALLIASTGGLALLAPRRWALLAAPLAVNFLSGNPAQQAFRLHYAAAALPFLFYAMAGGAAAVRARGAERGLLWLLAALIAASTSALPRYFVRVDAERRRAARRVLAMIPPDAPVQAAGNLYPHVAARRDAFLFPSPEPTPWVVVDREMTGFHPPEGHRALLADFERRHAARRVAEGGGVALYRRREAP